jgi:hypothetical protein
MFDECERLRENKELFRLLAHYAQGGTADRTAWQDRLIDLNGVAPKQLVTLHGELLAFEWVEQNTGATAAGYRVTTAGLRALKRAKAARSDEDEVTSPAST